MDTETSKKVSIPLIGCGGLLFFVSILVALFGAFHVFFDPRGAISADEALPALLGGACCSFPAFVLIVAGIFLFWRSRQVEQTEPEQ